MKTYANLVDLAESGDTEGRVDNKIWRLVEVSNLPGVFVYSSKSTAWCYSRAIIYTHHYFASHGANPKSTTRGLWTFRNKKSGEQFSTTNTYAKAVKAIEYRLNPWPESGNEWWIMP